MVSHVRPLPLPADLAKHRAMPSPSCPVTRIDIGEPSGHAGQVEQGDEGHLSQVPHWQEQAALHPRTYRRKVLLAALLGYLVVFGLLGLLLAGLAFCIMMLFNRINAGIIQISIILGISAWLILRSLMVRLDRPDGRKLAAQEAPALFALVEEVRRDVDGPPIAHLLLTDEFNAAIVQHPRLGPLGWHENYLLIGLPLMQALPVESLRAVVAHEFGHLANADGKLSSWVYRTRATWMQLSANLDQRASGWLLGKFFRWYGPWFNAMSFGLARQTEYAADALSARVTSSAIAGSTLARVELMARHYSEYHWPEQARLAAQPDQPAPRPFESAAEFFAEPPRADAVRRILTRALDQETGTEDTHPALTDRLAALAVTALELEHGEPSASAQLLPDAGRPFARHFDEKWWAETQGHWEQQRAERRQGAERLAELQQRVDQLSDDEAFELADHIEWLEGAEAARPHYAALAARPADVGAHYALARLQLNDGDDGGLDAMAALLKGKISPQDRRVIADYALDWIVGHAPAHPLTDFFGDQWKAADSILAATHAQSRAVDRATQFSALDNADVLLDALRAVAAGERSVRKLWLARAPIAADPDFMRFVLLFDSQMSNATKLGRLMDNFIAVLQPHGMVLVMQTSADRRWLMKRLDALPGGLIYQRK